MTNREPTKDGAIVFKNARFGMAILDVSRSPEMEKSQKDMFKALRYPWYYRLVVSGLLRAVQLGGIALMFWGFMKMAGA